MSVHLESNCIFDVFCSFWWCKLYHLLSTGASEIINISKSLVAALKVSTGVTLTILVLKDIWGHLPKPKHLHNIDSRLGTISLTIIGSLGFWKALTKQLLPNRSCEPFHKRSFGSLWNAMTNKLTSSSLDELAVWLVTSSVFFLYRS